MGKKPPPRTSSASSAPPSLEQRYARLAKDGRITDDAAQREALRRLEPLLRKVSAPQSLKLFRKPSAARKSGAYLWGGVGRGKSMLMKLFFDAAPIGNKKRVHFHAFMQDVHARIHVIRKEKKGRDGGDPVARLAREIADETALLCFDELQATDVADATLLHRLFSGLFEAGVIIVSTSNHPPASLYTGGVQRERFAKFIALIEERMEILPLSGPHDYRHLQMRAMEQTYFHPLGKAADAFVADAIQKLCANTEPWEQILAVQGRKLPVTLYDDAIGRFAFHALCEEALGAADYLALAARLDTMILTGIPRLPPEKRDTARRFVTLVDALYEHGVRLLCTAEAPPEELYSEGDGAFEFRRTASRLKEMQSARWLTDEH